MNDAAVRAGLLDPGEAQLLGWRRQYTELLNHRRSLAESLRYTDGQLEELADKIRQASA
jgi:hypothetical protein